MKGLASVILNVAILIVGIVLAALHGSHELLNSLSVISGIMFALPALVYMIYLLTQKEVSKRYVSQMEVVGRISGWVSIVGGLGLGMAMIITPETFRPLWKYIFSAAIILGGLYHFYIMAFAYRRVIFQVWLYLVPVTLVVTGIIVLATDFKDSNLVLISSIAMIVFAVVSFFEMYSIKEFEKQEDSLKIDSRMVNRDFNHNMADDDRHVPGYDYYSDDTSTRD